jgi:hypothetical protein
MSRKLSEQIAPRNIPDHHIAILRARYGESPIRADIETEYATCMPIEAPDFLTRCHIPQTQRFID